MSLPAEVVQQQIDLSQYTEKFRQPFLEALSTKKLVLTNKKINDLELIHQVIPFLKANPSITTLNVSFTTLNIGAYFINGPNVSLNPLSNVGFTHFSIAAGGVISVGSAPALYATSREDPSMAQAPKHGLVPLLSTLDVNLNQIGVEGKNADFNLMLIGNLGAQLLALITTLSTLNVRGNQIGDVGAKALALNTTLDTLDISYNQIGVEGKNALQAANQSRRDICSQQNLAFLSVMTLTDNQDLNAKKQQTLLFKYCKGIPTEKGIKRIEEALFKEILSYNKPKPLMVTF